MMEKTVRSLEVYTQKGKPVVRWVIVAFFALVFAADLVLVLLGLTAPIDEPVFATLIDMRADLLTIIAKGVTFCANTGSLIVVCAVLVLLPTRAHFGLPLSIATAISAGFHYVLKPIIERARPDEVYRLIEVNDFSFPSGHATSGLVFYIFLMILLRRYFILRKHSVSAWILTVLLPILVLAIGASRVYLGVHYASDVIGGWALGIVLTIVFYTVYDAWYPAKYRISYAPPSWDTLRRRKEWKHPDNSGKNSQLIEFPKYRSPWRRLNTPEKNKPEASGEER